MQGRLDAQPCTRGEKMDMKGKWFYQNEHFYNHKHSIHTAFDFTGIVFWEDWLINWIWFDWLSEYDCTTISDHMPPIPPYWVLKTHTVSLFVLLCTAKTDHANIRVFPHPWAPYLCTGYPCLSLSLGQLGRCHGPSVLPNLKRSATRIFVREWPIGGKPLQHKLGRPYPNWRWKRRLFLRDAFVLCFSFTSCWLACI